MSGWGSRFHGPIRCAGQQMQEISQEQPNLGLRFRLSAGCYEEDQCTNLEELVFLQVKATKIQEAVNQTLIKIRMHAYIYIYRSAIQSGMN